MEQLDNATRSKIRSTQILTSLPQMISELVQNSLDAGAKNIEIGIHCTEWTCWVRDDGTGINKDGLALIARGIEGGRYSSSKSYSPASLDEIETFGFRGEALASAADLSCIEISSRTARSKESWSAILKEGKNLYYGPSLRWRREGAGTTISLRDAFFNLPIRRLSHPNPARTIDLVRRELETFALVFPHVTFTLKDLSKENDGGMDKSRVMAIPRTDSTLSTFRHLYGRALVEQVDTIDLQSGQMKIEGFLSLMGARSRSYQFLYLNRHILDTCDLHRLVDKCFSSSTFAKHALDESGGSRTPRPDTRRSPKKGENRPVYVLNLTVPPRDVDNCLGPTKAAIHLQNYDAVASFLADAIQSFLTRHGFRTVHSRNLTDDSARPFRKRRKVTAGDMQGHSSEPSTRISTPVLGTMTGQSDPSIQPPSLRRDDGELTWVDPNNGRMYVIDPRTGNSYLRGQSLDDLENFALRPRERRRTVVDTWLRYACDDGSETPDWIKQALESNDAFASTERAIPCLPSSKNVTDGMEVDRRVPWTRQLDESFSTSVQYLGGFTIPGCSLSRESLAKVRVLGQVDCKFIACLINAAYDHHEPPEDGDEHIRYRTLVLVDQHAADERVRVEQLLKHICLGYLDRDGIGVERRTLDPLVPVLLTKFERDRLMGSTRIKKAFRDWGFDFADVNPAGDSDQGSESDEGYGMVHCGSVPEVVAEKLLSSASNDLRDLIKGYLARLETDSFHGSSTDTRQMSLVAGDASEFAWLRALRYCPQELIELVNSRACRGAIMFNDQLSMEQCKRLLRQLSLTAFPFQCAHGRPSVVPLTAIDSHRIAKTSLRDVDWHSLA